MQIRKYPIVSFGRDAFYVDTVGQAFFMKDKPEQVIPFSVLYPRPDGCFLLLYDRINQQAFYSDHIRLQSKLPEHVQRFIIPEPVALDPVGLARKYKLPDNDLIASWRTKMDEIARADRKNPRRAAQRVRVFYDAFDRKLMKK